MPGTNLTREEAATRAALVTVTRHDVDLDVTTGPETFSTRSTIHVTCAEPGAETFLDFVGGTVESITVNGTDLDPAEHYADSRVRLPGLAADNVVVVAATGRYTNTGEGLHRFVDPVDDEVYLYSQFEVPDSRRMYPVFEQPDLKARFTFTVTAPAHWQVVSNSPTPDPEPAGEGTATWRFAPTGPISSYITALVAGPYDVVRDTADSRAGQVPLGIFCRRSLTPYLDADNLFDLTKRGFAFFEEEFDCAYPFEKYDQIFTPEYNMGAMENAGLRHDQRDLRLPVQGHRVPRRAPRPDRAARARAHVVRQPRDDALVERPVAQRVLRRVGVHHLPGRGHALDRRLDHLRHPREGLGLPPGPAQLDPPDRGRDPRPARRRGQLRRHHLRQGRLGAQAAGGVRRARAVPRRAAGLLRQARLGQHHPRRPALRARGHLGARPAHLVRAVARDRRRQHAAPAGRGRRPRPHLLRRDRAELRPGLRDDAPAHARHRPVCRARRCAAPHRPPRARRRGRAHPRARPGRP